MALPELVAIAGRSWPTALPSFAAREELCFAWSEMSQEAGPRAARVYAAALGLCCPSLAVAARADYDRSRNVPLVFGGAVYSWLREQGATTAQVVEAGVVVLQAIAEVLFPREAEVEARAGFTASAGGAQT
jgi:hypothetical protein